MHFKINGNKAFLDFEKDQLRIGHNIYKLNNNLNWFSNRLYVKFNSNCNIKCIYCYQNNDRKNAPITDIDKYETLFKKLDNFDEIIIFGGEPLIETNLENIDFFLKQIYPRRVSIFTNGYHNEAVRKFINKISYQIENLIITVDGPEKIHNNRRKAGNNMQFQDLLNNIISYSNDIFNTIIQVNIDSDNINYIDILLNDLNDLFKKRTPQKVILNRVLHSNNSISNYDLINYFLSLKDFENICIDVNSLVYKKIHNYLNDEGIFLERCTAGRTMVFDFTSNNIYACPECKDTIVGEFDSRDFTIDYNGCNDIIEYSSKSIPPCDTCKLKKVCAFGCFIDDDVDGTKCFNSTKNEIKLVLDNFDSIFG